MFLCVLNILYLYVVERLQSLFINGWLVEHKTLAKPENLRQQIFFGCIWRCFEFVFDSFIRNVGQQSADKRVKTSKPPSNIDYSLLLVWISKNEIISQ